MRNLITCLTVSLLSSAVLADTWTVDDDGKADFDNIQAAVDAASDGDEIIVAPGTYTRNSSPVVEISDKDLWIRSSGGDSVTMIDGEGQNQCMYLWNSDSTIEGFKFRRGDSQYTGGMSIMLSDVTVNSCFFDDNYGMFFAGGLFVQSDSNVVIINTDFYDNTSEHAGAITSAGNCSLSNCSISGNTGNNSTGGIVVIRGNVSMEQCTVEWNDGPSAGGIWVDGTVWAELNLTDCNIWGNTANGVNKGILITNSARVQMYGENVVDNTYIEDPGSVAAFQAGSVCTMVGPYSPTTDAVTLLDIDAFGADALLQLTGTLRKNGCLTITNESRSLDASQLGHEISIIEFGQTEGGNGSVIFPVMPDGLGLKFIAGPINGGSGMRVKLKVIETQQASFSDPIPAGLSGVVIDISEFDADGDGEDELAILYAGTPGVVAVYEMSNDGSYPTEIADFTAFVGNDPVTIDAGDVNGDGLDDLLITNSIDNTLSVLLTQEGSEGNLYFTSSALSIPGATQSLTCGAIVNWDGDTDLDAVVGVDIESESTLDKYQVMLDIATTSPSLGPSFNIPVYVSDEVFVDTPTCVDGHETNAWGFVGGTRYGRVHRGTSVGSLQVIDELEGNNTVTIEAIELDEGSGDGQIDLMVSSDEAEVIYLFQGNAEESDGFDDLIPLGVSEPIEDLVALDVDDDGDMDIVMTAPTSDTPLVLLRNDGGSAGLVGGLNGITWSKQAMESGSPPNSIAGGTLGGKDEDKDWILSAGDGVGLRGKDMGTMEQTNIQFGTPCQSDLDRNQEVDVADILLLIADWGACEGCDADFNGDGSVAVDDLLVLIGAWGPCQ